MRTSPRSQRGVSLRELFPAARILGGADIHAPSVSTSADSCREGDVFVALLDRERDGHDVAEEAVARGASAVLCERLLPISVPQCLVRDSREAYGRLCQALVGHPAEQLKLIGVTGTAGKTVAAQLIRSMLETSGSPSGAATSLGLNDGVRTLASPGCQANAARLAEWCSRTLSHGCEYGVLEVSSQSLAQRRTAGIQFDGVVLTNVLSAHLDEHNTLEAYRKIKQRIFRQLKPHGFAVLNLDDPVSSLLARELDIPVLTVGINSPAEITAEMIERSTAEQTFLLTAGGDSMPVRTRIVGEQHVYNCLQATAVGLVLGLDLPAIVQGIERLECVSGRMERLECGQPFSVFVDSARTPAALATSLKALRGVATGKVTCVLGSPAGVAREERMQLAAVAERYAQRLVFTSDNPGHEEPLQVAHELLDGCTHPERAHISPDRARAIEWALDGARPGDAVLIAGKGDEAFQHVGKKRFAWCDSSVAREWLYQVGAKREYETEERPHRLRLYRECA